MLEVLERISNHVTAREDGILGELSSNRTLVISGDYDERERSQLSVEFGLHRVEDQVDVQVYWCKSEWGGETLALEYVATDPQFGQWTYSKKRELLAGGQRAASIVVIPMEQVDETSPFRVIISASRVSRMTTAWPAWWAMPEDFGQEAPIQRYVAEISWNVPIDRKSLEVLGGASVAYFGDSTGLRVDVEPLGPEPAVVFYHPVLPSRP